MDIKNTTGRDEMEEKFKINGRVFGEVANLTSALEEKGNWEMICDGCRGTVKDGEQETFIYDCRSEKPWYPSDKSAKWYCNEDCRELFYK